MAAGMDFPVVVVVVLIVVILSGGGSAETEIAEVRDEKPCCRSCNVEWDQHCDNQRGDTAGSCPDYSPGCLAFRCDYFRDLCYEDCYTHYYYYGDHREDCWEVDSDSYCCIGCDKEWSDCHYAHCVNESDEDEDYGCPVCHRSRSNCYAACALNHGNNCGSTSSLPTTTFTLFNHTSTLLS
ncbi:OLC1v1021142C1 [Oldenlandia corymbosa var. corymbosa]|uniref:OLC1v1021142C1 n=1 Tax=Oldenlandia corymbosa var. corymbosa TaxID=529605 RepID=A0AAV1BV07_OLDCO|nr:OLC1v1021142C1 [Oldenlandia corymbosa var. corymbosa]